MVALDVGAFHDAVTQAAEDVDDGIGGAQQRVAMARWPVAGRQGDVDGLAGDARLHRRLLEIALAFLQQALHLGLEHVGPLAHQGTLVAGQFAHGPQHPGELAFFAEQIDAQLLEGSGIGRGGDGGGGLGFEGLQLPGDVLQRGGGAQGKRPNVRGASSPLNGFSPADPGQQRRRCLC